MKIILIITLLMFSFLQYCGSDSYSNDDRKIIELYIANWNVENLFDTVDDLDKNDEWFLPNSEIEWNKNKLDLKLSNISKVIKFMNSEKAPDILSFEEVEHKHLIESLINNHLAAFNYDIVHYESPDERGIDNALIYKTNKLKLLFSEPLKINLSNNKYTRDILYAKFLINFSNDTLHIFVNHWPSRREGLKETEKNRIIAARTLLEKVNVLFLKSKSPNIIILGDFNDLPANESIKNILGVEYLDCNENNKFFSHLYNASSRLFQKGQGTYKYKDHWNMLDQIIISKSLLDDSGWKYICDSFEIIKPSFLIQTDKVYFGRPLPTFGGKKYLKGYSDHFPVGIKINFNDPEN